MDKAKRRSVKAETIIAIARREFVERGYRAVTIREVADKARVSTRTLYNHYTCKAALFTACVDEGGAAFPDLRLIGQSDPASALRLFAIEVVRLLSAEPALGLSRMILRDAAEFPEVVEIARGNYERFLLGPLAAYLASIGIAQAESVRLARLFLMMVTSEWHRSIIFGGPPVDEEKIPPHADMVTRVFMAGMDQFRA